MRDLALQRLGWFEERVEAVSRSELALPPARYAVKFGEGTGVVVYGEQCIAPKT